MRARVSARLSVARDDSRGGVPLAHSRLASAAGFSQIHMFNTYFDLSRGRPPPLRPFNNVVRLGLPGEGGGGP